MDIRGVTIWGGDIKENMLYPLTLARKVGGNKSMMGRNKGKICIPLVTWNSSIAVKQILDLRQWLTDATSLPPTI